MSVLAESQLRLVPEPLALRAIGPWLSSATDLLPTDVATTVLTQAELAVHEACMNVVDHATLPAGSLIELTLELSTDRLVVRIVDDGTEFRLADVPVPEPLSAQERGYGVKIIRSLVSEMSHRRIGSRNELQLTIDIVRDHDRG